MHVNILSYGVNSSVLTVVRLFGEPCKFTAEFIQKADRLAVIKSKLTALDFRFFKNPEQLTATVRINIKAVIIYRLIGGKMNRKRTVIFKIFN